MLWDFEEGGRDDFRLGERKGEGTSYFLRVYPVPDPLRGTGKHE